LDLTADLKLPREFPGKPDYRTWAGSKSKDLAGGSHRHVWEEIQWLRPRINELIDDMSALREISLSRQPLAAE
jgi:hypothetical protein